MTSSAKQADRVLDTVARHVAEVEEIGDVPDAHLVQAHHLVGDGLYATEQADAVLKDIFVGVAGRIEPRRHIEVVEFLRPFVARLVRFCDMGVQGEDVIVVLRGQACLVPPLAEFIQHHADVLKIFTGRVGHG